MRHKAGDRLVTTVAPLHFTIFFRFLRICLLQAITNFVDKHDILGTVVYIRPTVCCSVMCHTLQWFSVFISRRRIWITDQSFSAFPFLSPAQSLSSRRGESATSDLWPWLLMTPNMSRAGHWNLISRLSAGSGGTRHRSSFPVINTVFCLQ